MCELGSGMLEDRGVDAIGDAVGSFDVVGAVEGCVRELLLVWLRAYMSMVDPRSNERLRVIEILQQRGLAMMPTELRFHWLTPPNHDEIRNSFVWFASIDDRQERLQWYFQTNIPS